MPLGFTNTGFETAGTSKGVPADWKVVPITFGFMLAAYALSAGYSAYEKFEEGWNGNEDDLFAFDPGDLTVAIYDTIPEPREDFEEGWNGNQVHYVALPATALAAYDSTPVDFEDFEEEWLSNEDDVTSFGPGDTTGASYDFGVPEDKEDFEEEWSDNDTDISEFGPGDTTLASYDSGVPEQVEDFEEVDNVLYRITVDATGVDPDTFTVKIEGTEVKYSYTGVGTTATIRDILVTYINAALAGIATANAEAGSTFNIKSVVPNTELTVSIDTTGSAEMSMAIPDRTAYWTQLLSLD